MKSLRLFDRVIVDEPQDEDSWAKGFNGLVLKVDKTFAIVQNLENDYLYCVDLQKIIGVK